jgi:tRNA(fMet)-specific endonuclease VapC
VIHVLDTNVVSGLMRGDEGLVRRLGRLKRADVLVPQPVVAEIEYGLHRLVPSRRREALRARFEALRSVIERAPWTDQVSAQFGIIKASLERQGQPIEDMDVAIAAHAAALGGVLVTSNVQHMIRVQGLRVEQWP